MDILSNSFSALCNAQKQGHPQVRVPFSSHVWNVLCVLYIEGYIQGFRRHETSILVKLRYTGDLPGILRMRRISRPGKKVYTSARALPTLRQGLGSYILATSYGVLCDRDAARLGCGGELLAYVV